MSEDHPFLLAFRGSFVSALRWEQLDELWDSVRRRADAGWYVYAVGEPPPAATVGVERLCAVIGELDGLLRREHEADYCGIVYADDLSAPAFVKVYDPGRLGVVCGFSAGPPLPGWVISLLPPVDLRAAFPLSGARKRWWRRLLGG
jgi:hypothetical protein